MTHFQSSCVSCVCLLFLVHVPQRLNWANSERGFCPFHAGIIPQAPVRIIQYVCKYGSSGATGPACQLSPLCLPRRGRVCVFACVCFCVCLQSSHASRHGCFLLSCGSPFVFSSGCWLLSRCCSSCCSTLSSTGNFWSRRSTFSLCSHSQGCSGVSVVFFSKVVMPCC